VRPMANSGRIFSQNESLRTPMSTPRLPRGRNIPSYMMVAEIIIPKSCYGDLLLYAGQLTTQADLEYRKERSTEELVDPYEELTSVSQCSDTDPFYREVNFLRKNAKETKDVVLRDQLLAKADQLVASHFDLETSDSERASVLSREREIGQVRDKQTELNLALTEQKLNGTLIDNFEKIKDATIRSASILEKDSIEQIKLPNVQQLALRAISNSKTRALSNGQHLSIEQATAETSTAVPVVVKDVRMANSRRRAIKNSEQQMSELDLAIHKCEFYPILTNAQIAKIRAHGINSLEEFRKFFKKLKPYSNDRSFDKLLDSLLSEYIRRLRGC